VAAGSGTNISVADAGHAISRVFIHFGSAAGLLANFRVAVASAKLETASKVARP
jgi:hypothetical protein